MSESYRVIFSGEVVQGCEVGEVKEQIAAILKEDSEYIDNLFSGKPNVIIEDPDLSKCQKIMNVFISVGAVCFIEDPESESEYVLEVITKGTSQPIEAVVADSPAEPEKKETKKEAKKKSKKAGASTSSRIKGLLPSKEKIKKIWQEASTSIKSDFEDGGAGELVTNRYCQSFAGGLVVFLLVVIVTVTYQGKAMPLTEENYNTVVNHVAFIENAFTYDELQNMKNNPADYLDYLLVFPIEKLGYKFEETVGEIAGTFIKNGFSKEKRKRALSFLEIPTSEREKLFEIGIISEMTKKQLDLVSQKMGK